MGFVLSAVFAAGGVVLGGSIHSPIVGWGVFGIVALLGMWQWREGDRGFIIGFLVFVGVTLLGYGLCTSMMRGL